MMMRLSRSKDNGEESRIYFKYVVGAGQLFVSEEANLIASDKD